MLHHSWKMLWIASIVDFWFRIFFFFLLDWTCFLLLFVTFLCQQNECCQSCFGWFRGGTCCYFHYSRPLGSQGRENQPCSNNYLRPRHTIPFISSVHLFLVIFSQVAPTCFFFVFFCQAYWVTSFFPKGCKSLFRKANLVLFTGECSTNDYWHLLIQNVRANKTN